MALKEVCYDLYTYGYRYGTFSIIAIKSRVIGWQIASISAVLIMVFWIVGEVVSIRLFHYLQIIDILR